MPPRRIRIEASIKTIDALATAIKGKTAKPKVVVCIQTDGQENQSGPEYTWDRLKALIEAKTKEGWQFNFMGAGTRRAGSSTSWAPASTPTTRAPRWASRPWPP
jgi:hypothetical protein